jgi:hypothetical protein
VVIAGRQRNDSVEMLTLHPELKFAGSVAGVFTAFKHRDDNDFDTDRRNRRHRGRGRKMAGTERR